jgi:ribosomal protein S18 acetylase RimI-like enzyme
MASQHLGLDGPTANIRDFWLGYGAEHRAGGDLTVFRSGMPDAQLNGVLRMRGGDLDEAIRQVSGRLVGVPWCWHAGPDSYPGLHADLLGRGATEAEMLPLMAVPLDRVTAPEGPLSLVISEVARPGELGEWARSYAPSFHIPTEAAGAVEQLEAIRADPPGSFVRLIGRINGQVAGTAALYDRHDVAGIYNVTTPPAYRRRGIGTAMTAAALLAGRDRGLSTGILQATPDGAPVYRRMGFTTVGEYRLMQLPGGQSG